MDSKPDFTAQLALAVAAVAASSAALFFGTGLHPLWWLAWIATLPVLLAATRLPRWTAFAVAFAAWSVGSLNMWHYYRAVDVPMPVALSATLLPSLIFAVAAEGFRSRVM